MGETCSCEADTDDLAYELNLGLEYDGCTEEYHYHKEHIKQLTLELSPHDRFYRSVLGPLHLMDIKMFLKKID